MSILNKEEVTKNAIQYHIAMKPNDIGEYVLLPGDPARSDIVAKYLDDAKLVANNREHRTYTGYYKGVKVSVTSTGMGCPSAAIASEELINIGAKVLIRIGSTAALQDEIKIGDLIISSASMKNEGTSKFYVPNQFPAIPDFQFTNLIQSVAKELTNGTDVNVFTGISATDDAFYGETPEWIQKLIDLKVTNIEMEASAIFTVAHVRGIKAACICGVSGNLKTGEVIYQEKNVKLAEAWEREIQIILEAIYRQEQLKE
ncbi:nucleoside phosphorylase [Mycoplasmatota bacterium zrk1]